MRRFSETKMIRHACLRIRHCHASASLVAAARRPSSVLDRPGVGRALTNAPSPLKESEESSGDRTREDPGAATQARLETNARRAGDGCRDPCENDYCSQAADAV
jgi:hypothetical protein